MTEERRPLPYTWPELRKELQEALPMVLGRLNLRCDLTGKPMGENGVMYPRNPTRSDKRAGSFVIWTGGNAIGAWKDYATAGPDAGDIFDLIAYVGRLRTKMDAYWRAIDILGKPRKGFENNARTLSDIEQERQSRERDRQAAEAKQIEDDEARSVALFKLWLSLPPIAGTPAERYLTHARRMPRETWPKEPDALRWAERVEYVNQTTGEVTEWRNVMVSAMTRGKKLVALHRTYLKPDGSGKADLAKNKLMIGPVRGSAIRLSRGPTGLSPTKAAAAGKRGPMALGEGIETSWTVACARHDYRVWAAGSLSLMGLLDWPDCASAVVLLGENDWKPEARRAFERVVDHWRKQAKGRDLVVAHPERGSDFNDMVRQ